MQLLIQFFTEKFLKRNNETIIKTNNITYSSILTDCDELLLSTSHILHMQIYGKVKHYNYFGGEKSKIDMRKT